MLEKADSAEAQKILAILLIINYQDVLPERPHCSQSLFFGWHSSATCTVVLSMMTFVTLLESLKCHPCLAVILEKQDFVTNKTNK